MRHGLRIACGIIVAAMACSGERAPARADVAASSSTAPAAGADTMPPAGAPQASARPVCARPARGIIVGTDSLAGLPADATLGALVRACTVSTADVYTIGGDQPPARIFPFVGATLTAVQSTRDGSLRYDEAPDLWAAEGDSVRLSDGELMPRTVGELRRRYPRGVVTSDKRDDSEGVRIISCSFPGLEFILSYSAPTPATVGRWPLSAKALPDTSHIFSVEIFPQRVAADSSCAATSAS